MKQIFFPSTNGKSIPFEASEAERHGNSSMGRKSGGLISKVASPVTCVNAYLNSRWRSIFQSVSDTSAPCYTLHMLCDRNSLLFGSNLATEVQWLVACSCGTILRGSADFSCCRMQQHSRIPLRRLECPWRLIKLLKTGSGCGLNKKVKLFPITFLRYSVLKPIPQSIGVKWTLMINMIS